MPALLESVALLGDCPFGVGEVTTADQDSA